MNGAHRTLARRVRDRLVKTLGQVLWYWQELTSPAPVLLPRLAFLVQSEELINHFGQVWEKMAPGSFDVLLHGLSPEERRAVIERVGRWSPPVADTADVLQKRQKYAHLVSNHPVEVQGEPLIRRLAHKNVRFMYSAGKTGWNLRWWNKLYDMILCFGPYHAAAFRQWKNAQVVEIGYPRLDVCFDGSLDREALRRQLGCDPSKPTVLWLPTWKELSTVGHFDEAVAALLGDFNVLVKLHPYMAESDPAKVAALQNYPWTRLLTDSSNNAALYVAADFVLCDYGGSPLASVYTDKNMLLLNVPNGAADEFTGADSPDVTMRSEIVNANPGDDLRAILKDPAVWEEQREKRRKLRDLYFAPYYGRSAEVAASVLQDLGKRLPVAP